MDSFHCCELHGSVAFNEVEVRKDDFGFKTTPNERENKKQKYRQNLLA